MSSLKPKATIPAALPTIRDAFQRQAGEFAKAVPSSMQKYFTADRITKIALSTISKDKKLLRCTIPSLLLATMNLVQLGIEPGGPLQQGYIVPYENKKAGTMEAQAIVGYRGYIMLARRSGEITTVAAPAVYKNDKFKIQLGTDPKIEHEPFLDGPRGEFIASYCVAQFRGDNGYSMDFMTKYEIDDVRKSSPGGNSPYSPWANHYVEMARKTIVRRAQKYWPLSTELQMALEMEQEQDDKIFDASFAIESMSQIDDNEQPEEIETEAMAELPAARSPDVLSAIMSEQTEPRELARVAKSKKDSEPPPWEKYIDDTKTS